MPEWFRTYDSEYMQNDSFIKKVNDPSLKAILKYWNHPRILAIDVNLENKFVFTFCHITSEEILKKAVN